MPRSVTAGCCAICGTRTRMPSMVKCTPDRPRPKRTHTPPLPWKMPDYSADPKHMCPYCLKMGSNPQCWSYRNPVRSSMVYANQFCEDVPVGDFRCHLPPKPVSSLNHTMPLFISVIGINRGIPTLHFRPMVNNNSKDFGSLMNVCLMLTILLTLQLTVRNVWLRSSYWEKAAHMIRMSHHWRT